jgi:hypothetical protein
LRGKEGGARGLLCLITLLFRREKENLDNVNSLLLL